jgi:hypothetical protein
MSTPGICPCDSFVHPQILYNPPELTAIAYRVGDYIGFREALLRSRPGEVELINWRPGATGDLAVQMIEWWAYLADILTFYNQRIANQDYLRTADLPEGVQNLIRILGYRPRPGIGATGTLAAVMTGIKTFTLPAGFQVQSKPGPGKQPQIFELGAPVTVQKPDVLAAFPPPSPLLLGPDGSSVLLAGSIASIKPGDQLLLLPKNWSPTDVDYALVTVASAAPETAPNKAINTRIALTAPIDRLMTAQADDYRLLRSTQKARLWQFPAAADSVLHDLSNGSGIVHLNAIARLISVGDPLLFQAAGTAPFSQIAGVTAYSEAVYYANPSGSPPDPTVPPPSPPNIPIPILHSAVSFLAAPQQAGWLPSTDAATLTADLTASGDQIIDLSVFTQAGQQQLAAVTVPGAAQALQPEGLVTGGNMLWLTGLDAAGIDQAVLTNNASPSSIRAYTDTDGSIKFSAVLLPGTMGEVWWYVGIDAATVADYLAQNEATLTSIDAYLDTDGTVKFAVVMAPSGATFWWYWGIDAGGVTSFLSSNNARLTNISAYVDIDGTIRFAVIMVPDNGQNFWWYWGLDASAVAAAAITSNATLTSLDTYIAADGTVRYAVVMQAAPQLPVSNWGVDFATLAVLYGYQDVGTLIESPASTLTGTSIDLVTPLPAEILPMNDEPILIGDATGNGIASLGTAATAAPGTIGLSDILPAATLDAPLSVFFNLLSVSRGKTVAREVLGSGDATISVGQEFVLQKSPLTYLQSGASSSGAGYTSALQVWVDGVQWSEVPSFYGQPPNAQVFVTREDDRNKTHVQFGDGVNGARLPSGTNNVVASYRYGSGAESPDAGTLSVILQSWPGLKSIVNPVAVGGGSDPDPISKIKTYAPQSVLTFGRAISANDYEVIAAQAPGVARATSYCLWDTTQQRMLVKVYVGEDFNAVSSANTALSAASDPNRPYKVLLATAVPLALQLSLVVDPRYVPDDVVNGVTAALIDPDRGLFGVSVVRIGQSVFHSRLAKVCLSVPGALAVHDLSLSGATTQCGPDCADFDFRYDPGEGGFFQLAASNLTISPEVAANAG